MTLAREARVPSLLDEAGLAAQGVHALRIEFATSCREPQKLGLKDTGFAYVGISLDGIGATHDHFRGRQGAFEKTVAAFRHCKAVGQKVGLRLTLSTHNIADLDRILEMFDGRLEIRHLSVGREALDIDGQDQDGKRFKLSDYRGKVVLLYFWSEY